MLVDTNVLSELMRPRPNPRVVDWAGGLDAIALSVVTVEEVCFGLRARPSARLEKWFDSFAREHCEVLAVTEPIARRSAWLRGQLRRRGAVRTQADMLIAATAYEHGLAVATRNERDFEGCGVPVVNPFR